jgi:hypothetical protein
MKSIISTLFIVILFNTTQAQVTKTILTGDRGIFKYEMSYNWDTKKQITEFKVMHKLDGGGEYGTIFGEITQKTTVSFLNPELKGLSVKNLSILDGKEVLVICKMKQSGLGEGSTVTCLDLKILLIQE